MKISTAEAMNNGLLLGQRCVTSFMGATRFLRVEIPERFFGAKSAPQNDRWGMHGPPC